MFGLVETALIPVPSLWGRACAWWKRESGVHVHRRRLWDTSVAHVHIDLLCDAPREKNLRRVEAALTKLSEMGVTGVVLPSDFPYRDALEPFGMAASTPVPLYRMLAAKLVMLAAEELRLDAPHMRIAVMGRRVTYELTQAARLLCKQARTFMLSAGRDTEALAKQLHTDCGVSAVVRPTDEQLASANIFLVFDPLGDGACLPSSSGSAVLLLCGGRFRIHPGCLVADGAQLEPPARIAAEWPHFCDSAALLTALVAVGTVSPSEIHVGGLTWHGAPAAL